MEKFKPTKLPSIIDGSVMLIDTESWNNLINYVNSQTIFINNVVDTLNSVIEKETSDSEAIKTLAQLLKEHLEK